MHIVLVYIHVKPEFVQAFQVASLDNAKNSIQEPGIARFDLIQEMEDPTKFVLIEEYRTPEDVLKHKETAHYARWRDAVVDMMAEPRKGVKYIDIHPTD